MKSTEPADYVQKVYAGVLGKTIGVYTGKPIEGRSNADIERTSAKSGTTSMIA